MVLSASRRHTCSSQSKPGSETRLEARDPLPLVAAAAAVATELQDTVIAAVGREVTLSLKPSAVWKEGTMISGRREADWEGASSNFLMMPDVIPWHFTLIVFPFKIDGGYGLRPVAVGGS